MVVGGLVALAGCLDGPDADGSRAASPVEAWSFTMPLQGLVTLDATADGRLAALAVQQGPVEGAVLRVIETNTGRERLTFEYPYAFCCSMPVVGFDATGSRVAVGGDNLHVFDTGRGKELARYDPELDGRDFPEVPAAIDVAPSGDLVVAPTWAANRLLAWAPGGGIVWEDGFGNGGDFADARISGDGNVVVLASSTNVTRYAADTGVVLSEHGYRGTVEDSLPKVAVSHDGSRFAVLTRLDSDLVVAAFDASERLPVWRSDLEDRGTFGDIFMTPDARIIAASSFSKSAILTGDGSILVGLWDGERVLDLVPVERGALLLVDRGDDLAARHIGLGTDFEHGAIPRPDGFKTAVLTPRGIVTVSKVRDDAGAPFLRVALHEIEGLPWTGGTRHGP